MSDTPPPISSYRPEQQFFEDPVLDRLMAVTMTLAAEVYILRERIDDLECAMVGSPSSDEAKRNRGADAAAFVQHLLQPLLGEQQSRGPQ
jgi:hypothetical protein